MNINFNQCFEWLLINEGGYVNNPEDTGGETNLGVTKKTYLNYCEKNNITLKDMHDLTKQDVGQFIELNIGMLSWGILCLLALIGVYLILRLILTGQGF